MIAGLPYRRHVGLRRTPVNISEFNNRVQSFSVPQFQVHSVPAPPSPVLSVPVLRSPVLVPQTLAETIPPEAPALRPTTPVQVIKPITLPTFEDGDFSQCGSYPLA